MIDVRAAEQILDFQTRIGDARRAREQLEGAVALHNVLEREGVAYLADEVGMGKTYVAMGALALFRHYAPNFRVLIVAPRENIQKKWMKELQNFVRHNVRYADLRMKGFGGRPARAMVFCDRLATLAREATSDLNRDFFVRLTSFSLAFGEDVSEGSTWSATMRKEMRGALPWLDPEVFRATSKKTWKDNVARALCCALPVFDLVIVDEAHNLKHGFQDDSAARNRTLALALGHPAGAADARLFPGYGPRARRVLFLSATPIDGAWRHLWNQLNVVGRADSFAELAQEPTTEQELEAAKAAARRILVRRVTQMHVGDQTLTKNLYRREWRRGGVQAFDEPIQITDDRQRLVLALVQKKVSEVIRSDKFGPSFQIGMLASFESFLQTAKVKSADGTSSTFDDSEQTHDAAERDGVDVDIVNRLARDHRERFGHELPHPKMDALVDALSQSWVQGRKALVFVRRVASVKEIKRKLDDRYDVWLFDRLRREAPAGAQRMLETAMQRYQREKREARDRGLDDGVDTPGTARQKHGADVGGTDTFFAWFFRGDGPKGVFSGSAVAKRFSSSSGSEGTFFERNHVADLLGVRPADAPAALARALGTDDEECRRRLGQKMLRFLPRTARLRRGERFEAAQAAAVAMLGDVPGPWQEAARVLWRQRYMHSQQQAQATVISSVDGLLETRTFFSELQTDRLLTQALWPDSDADDVVDRIIDRERRALLLSATARLGHPFIDLYLLALRRQGIENDDRDDDEGGASGEGALVDEYLALLRRQQAEPQWNSFRELASVAENYALLLDTNLEGFVGAELVEGPALLGSILQRQQPVAGMSGSARNSRVIKQFRMPGYPFVLVTTDVLQEGEDLHTFCSDVYHYGIAWTPSSMEQRIGRIDRVRSQSDRRLGALTRAPDGHEKLQVLYPHLEDTVEKVQVDVVLARMNRFLRLMHEGWGPPDVDDRRVHLARALLSGPRHVGALDKPLQTSFPVDRSLLHGDIQEPAVTSTMAHDAALRLSALRTTLRTITNADLSIDWEPEHAPGLLLGTAHLCDDGAKRQQPFALMLRSVGERLVVRCVSPIGQVMASQGRALADVPAARMLRIGVIVDSKSGAYDMTVEDDVLLGDPAHDHERVARVVARVVRGADRLEQVHLPDRDQPLAIFRPQIDSEANPDER
jgi:hypothetical protein